MVRCEKKLEFRKEFMFNKEKKLDRFGKKKLKRRKGTKKFGQNDSEKN